MQIRSRISPQGFRSRVLHRIWVHHRSVPSHARLVSHASQPTSLSLSLLTVCHALGGATRRNRAKPKEDGARATPGESSSPATQRQELADAAHTLRSRTRQAREDPGPSGPAASTDTATAVYGEAPPAATVSRQPRTRRERPGSPVEAPTPPVPAPEAEAQDLVSDADEDDEARTVPYALETESP